MVSAQEVKKLRERLKNIFPKIKKLSKNKADDENSRYYSLWLLILPVILGFSLGSLADSVLSLCFGMFTNEGSLSDTAVTGTVITDDKSSKQRGLDAFLSSNPFKISPQKTNTPPPPEKPKIEEPPQQPDMTLDGVILRGTLPNVGGWFEINGELKALMIGNSIDKYKLISVSYREAKFRKGDEAPVSKFIIYGPVAAVQPKPAPAPAPAPQRASQPQQQTGSIVAAVPDQQEGQISSEMVNQLVQNPFDELKRIRIRPNDTAGGLEVQWIQNDSLLKRLGVQRGDVIRSVNGIPFTNMGDIANSINSLMNSERFDVEVTRGGTNTALRYVVK